jgi:predicted RNase H-like HicB family nuclease
MQATSDSHAPTRDASDAERLAVTVFVHWEEDHWSAVIPDFTITGRGDTPEAAIANAGEGLCGYLDLCRSQGMSFEDARRPISRRWRMQIRAALLRTRIVRKLGGHGAEERSLPISDEHHLAAC